MFRLPAVARFNVWRKARSWYIHYLQTKPHTGWMLFETISNLGAWSCVGANGQPGSMAIGNILMLLMKPPPAQGESALSFPHQKRY
jgi:hypothetical protein